MAKPPLYADDTYLIQALGHPAFIFSPQSLQHVESWAKIAPGDQAFYWTKIPVEQREYVNLLLHYGWQLIETELAFVAEVCPSYRRLILPRPLRLGENQQVADLVAQPEHTRWYADPQFPDEVARQMRVDQFKRAMDPGDPAFPNPEGHGCVVIDHPDLPDRLAALLLFRLPDEEGAARIIYLVVDEELGGQGFGKTLLSYLFNILHRHHSGCTLRAGTQLTNRAATGLYESMGMRLSESRYVLHYWGRW